MSTQQSQVMHQMLIEEYKVQKARLKQIREKLNNQSEFLSSKIQKELQNLKQASQMIIKSAAKRTQMYVESLEQGSSSPNVIDISILSSYLKQQKSHLSQLISSQQQNSALKSKTKSGKELLHTLSKRKKIQKYFQHLQCFKLQKEIQYLQKNILSGKSTIGKQTIIYDNVDSVTLKEEQQLKQKMKILLDQLERVVGLSSQCGGDIDEGYDTKLLSLRQQAQRLQKIQQIVDKQTKEIVMVKDFFNSHNPTEAIQLLQHKINKLQIDSLKDKLIKKPTINNLIENEQLKFLINFQCQPIQNVKVYKKPFDQVNDLLASCKAKLKKVKI